MQFSEHGNPVTPRHTGQGAGTLSPRGYGSLAGELTDSERSSWEERWKNRKCNSTDLLLKAHSLPATLLGPEGSKMNEAHSLPPRTLAEGGGGRGQVRPQGLMGRVGALGEPKDCKVNSLDVPYLPF